VKSGETTAPYCAVFALLGRVPFVLGEMVSVQMPHQHRTLGEGRKSIFYAVQHSSGLRGKRTRQSREDGGTISISRPENQHEWAAKEQRQVRKGSRTVNGLCLGGLFNL
jgi:hypothetical protein